MSQHWPSARTADAQTADLLDIEAACNTVFVRNLSFDVDDKQLAKYFEDIGPVKRAFTVKDKNTDISRGFGFVEFTFPHDAKFAVSKLNGKAWFDRELRVELALQQAKDPLQRQREKEQLMQQQRKQQQQDFRAKKKDIKEEQKQYQEQKLMKEEQQYHNEAKKYKVNLAAQPNPNPYQTGGRDSYGQQPTPVYTGTVTGMDGDNHNDGNGEENSIGCVLLITGLDQQVDEPEILNKCSKYGNVTSIIYPSPETIPPTADKPAQLAARVTFVNYREAKACVDGLEQRSWGANRVKAHLRLLSSQAAVKVARLIVRNLSFKTQEDDVRQIFQKYGNVLEVHFPRSITGHMRGFGFVQMDNFETALKCVNELNGQTLNGRQFTVDFTIPKSQFDTLASLKPKISTQPIQLKTQDDIEKENKTMYQTQRYVTNPANPDLLEDLNVDSSDDSDSEYVKEDADGNRLVKLENGERPDPTDDKLYEAEFAAADGETVDDEDTGNSELVYNEEGEEDAEDEDHELDLDDVDHDFLVEPKKDNKAQKTNDTREGRTIFIRNLSYDTDEEGLYTKFSEFGKILLVKICRDSILNRSLGTAFIKFEDKAVVDNLLANHAGEKKSRKDQYKKHKKESLSASVMNSAVRVDGRDLILSLAVDRTQAKELTIAGEKTKDKRNLYLAKEGVIMPETAACEGVSKADMEKRTRGWQEKKQKLRNPNFAVSTTRLSVRNIPLQLQDKELRQLCYNTVKLECKKMGKKVGDITLKQVRIERDPQKFDKDGLPKSRGFGFVEFRSHEHSLIALRALNNNPAIWGTHKRPIVEFALEDARKLLIHRKRLGVQLSKQEKTAQAKSQAEADALALLSGKKQETKELQDLFKNRGQVPGSAQKRPRADQSEQDKNKRQRI